VELIDQSQILPCLRFHTAIAESERTSKCRYQALTPACAVGSPGTEVNEYNRDLSPTIGTAFHTVAAH
jgi:hypothetical protein